MKRRGFLQTLLGTVAGSAVAAKLTPENESTLAVKTPKNFDREAMKEGWIACHSGCVRTGSFTFTVNSNRSIQIKGEKCSV